MYMSIVIRKIIVILMAILLAVIVAPSAFAESDSAFAKDEFEIMGEISAIAGNNFVVSNHTIFIDPSQVKEFEQKGILEVGKRVKVEGIVKNGVNFAEEINVIGTGQGKFKFEVKDQSAAVGTTAGSEAQVQIKAVGSVSQINTFLEQILAFLKSLIS